MTPAIWWAIGAANGLLAVALGAVATHALRGRLSPPMLDIFEVGVRYHMYHALAMLAVALLAARGRSGTVTVAGWCFVAGIVLFCGSLYVLALGGTAPVGLLTPVGGLALLLGWVLLAIGGAALLRSP